MRMIPYLMAVTLAVLGMYNAPALAQTQLDGGKEALKSMAGCYLIDYSYTETEGLKPGYQRDSRVYDVNKDKSVKEWIYAEDISNHRVRLQHIMFMTDLAGNFAEGSILKHTGEDWEYEAQFLYEFTAPSRWDVRRGTSQGQWTRKITNLDDGLRYQCTAAWDLNTQYPDWSCDNYAPIPGRETRDLGRKDYNTLQRSTRLVLYGNSWLERQSNTKIVFQDGTKIPLAKELGKNWYVRLPDSECRVAQEFIQPRRSFWVLLRETWDEVLAGDRTFVEKVIPRQPPRFVKMGEIEESYITQNLSDPSTRANAKADILKVIGTYRADE